MLSKLDLSKYNYGCFYKKFKPNNFLLSILEILNNFQTKTLKKQGSKKIIKDKIITSSRKFEKKWFFKTIIFMQYIRFLYFIWTDTKILEEKYENFN